ncbi:MAG: transcriptional repressor [Candidatus Roizmanbacteria bacterium]|nr:transcriptional repressor [Candidatus Roizmanbacteria bacterium]
MKAISTIEQLRTSGFRMGRVRKEIITLFSKAVKPISAQNILDTLSQKDISANKTTVYRELDFLKEQRLIKELQLQSNVRHFESADQDHHHHLVCENCDRIIPVEDDHLEQHINDLTRRIKKSNKFTIDRHALEFFGLCQHCH